MNNEQNFRKFCPIRPVSPHTPWARSFCPFRACCFWSFTS